MADNPLTHGPLTHGRIKMEGITCVENGITAPAIRAISRALWQWLAGRYPVLTDLFARPPGHQRTQKYMVAGVQVDGIPLRVAELTGRAGDVFFMHPWTFHAPALNTGTTPAWRSATLFFGRNSQRISMCGFGNRTLSLRDARFFADTVVR